MNHYYSSPDKRYGNTLCSYLMDFRSIALLVDSDPMAIKQYVKLPGIQFLLSDCDSSALERTRYLEAFSYGDPGVLLASPGPSLSGLMLRELGTQAQIDDFYSMIKAHHMRTFFALTEPNKGSDANHIETELKKINKTDYFLHGQKCFFGNGAVAETGIVLARINSGPVGIRAVWLTPDLLLQSSVLRETLSISALRGSQIAIMKLDNLKIPTSAILGSHRSACENGLLGILKVFNRLRTGVGALAIGQAQAVYDLVYLNNLTSLKSTCSFFSCLYAKLESARNALHYAAKSVDDNPFSFEVVSASKIIATRTAQNVIDACISVSSFENLLENPWLMKSYRDAFCWEYMEGTTAIQKIQLYKKISEKSQGVYDAKLSLPFAA